MSYLEITSPVLQAGIYIRKRLDEDSSNIPSVAAIVAAANKFVENSKLDFIGAERVAQKLGWNVFCLSESIEKSMADSLFNIIVSQFYKPDWIDVAYMGRSYVVDRFKTVNERQLFNNAGLLSNDSMAAHQWWSKLALISRKFSVENTEDAGERWLECEQLSFLREQSELVGTEFAPRLVSIDDCTLGFDIETFRLDGSLNTYRRHFIEVKSCSIASKPRFFISNSEWNFAIRNREMWQLDFYGHGSESAKVLTYQDILPLMPSNTSRGKWLKAEVSLA